MTRAMVGLFSLLATSASTPALAVDPCRTGETVKDDFNGGVETFVIGGPGSVLGHGDGRTIWMYGLGASGNHGDVIPAGFVLELALQNGTVVSLTAPEATKPNVRRVQYMTNGTVTGTSTSTSWIVLFELTPEALHVLAQSDPVAIRYAIGDEQHTADLTPKVARLTRREFACVANRVPYTGPESAPDGEESPEPPPTSPPDAVADGGPPRSDGEAGAADVAPVEGASAETATAPQANPATPPLTALPSETARGERGGSGKGSTALWVAAGASGALSAGLYANAAVQRGQFLDDPTEQGFKRTNASYWGSVGAAVVGLGFTGVAVSGRF